MALRQLLVAAQRDERQAGQLGDLDDPLGGVLGHLDPAVVDPAPEDHALLRGELGVGEQLARRDGVQVDAAVAQVPAQRVDHHADPDEVGAATAVQRRASGHLGHVEHGLGE